MFENSLVQLSLNLYSGSRLLIQRIQAALLDSGLTYPQFLALSILWKEDGLKVHELGRHLNLDSGTLTPLLKKLEAQNLLRRKRGEEDERTVTIHLTYPGKSLQVKTMEAIAVLEQELVEEMGEEFHKILPVSESFLEKLSSPN